MKGRGGKEYMKGNKNRRQGEKRVRRRQEGKRRGKGKGGTVRWMDA